METIPPGEQEMYKQKNVAQLSPVAVTNSSLGWLILFLFLFFWERRSLLGRYFGCCRQGTSDYGRQIKAEVMTRVIVCVGVWVYVCKCVRCEFECDVD